MLSTNFFYFSGLINTNTDPQISAINQTKFIAAFLNSSFGQIQFEIHSNNQEGMRKLEGFHINEFNIPDLKQLTKSEIDSVVSEFDALNSKNVIISGDEGIVTPRRELDEEIANIIFNKNSLGFSSSTQLTNFFELF